MQTIKKGTRYSQIAEYYRRMIDQKTLAVGEKMPTENQICALFQVSRITVREAMNELVKDGYIERIQGKGSYVKAKRVGMQLNHLQGFSEEMRLKGMTASSQVLSVEVQPCKPKVAALLRIDEGAQVISINRLRLADGEPMAVENVFIPFFLCPELAQRELNGSLYRLLAEYGLRIARAQQDITSGFSPRPICELLQIKPTVPTLQIERITYLENGQPLTAGGYDEIDAMAWTYGGVSVSLERDGDGQWYCPDEPDCPIDQSKAAIMQSIIEKTGPGTPSGAICFSLPVSQVAGLRRIEE